MSNTAKITITAIDNATATMLKIRAEMRAMTQPVRDIKASMGRFTEASGLKQFGRDMGKVGHAARAVAGNVTRIVAPLAAVVGIGSIGAIGEMARRWGELGWNVERTAQTLGVAPAKLQALQGAAQLAGLSAEDMTSSLDALGKTMYSAKWSGNNAARYAMNQFGLQFRLTKKGAIDTAQSLQDIATVMQKLNRQPQLQEKLAAQFGVGALLPLLRQGPDAIRKYEQEANRSGYVQSGRQLKHAEELAQANRKLGVSVTGLGNSILAVAGPILTPYIDALEKWIEANRMLIATKVKEWIGDIVKWVKRVDWGAVWVGIKQTVAQILAIATGVESAVQALGGWKNAFELAFGLWAGTKIVGLTTFVWKLVTALRAAASTTGVGLLGRAGLVAGAGVAGYEFGKHVVNPAVDWTVNKLTGGKEKNLGGAIYDWTHPGQDKRQTAKTLFPAMERQYGLPKGLLDAVWAQESSRGKDLYSPAGAIGDFQFMPSTAAQYGLKNPLNFDDSTVAAARMYRDLLGSYRGDTQKALAAYNWGSGNLNKDVAKNGSNWLKSAPAETQNYVHSIMARMEPAPQQTGGVAPAPQLVHVKVSLGNLPPGSRATAVDMAGKVLPLNLGYSMHGAY